jgi:hypothetical protein
MHVEMEAVAEPVVPTAPKTEALEEEANMEDGSVDPSILHVYLNED